MAQDIELAQDLLDDVSDVIGEYGNSIFLIKTVEVAQDEFDPTADNFTEETYETLGVIFTSRDSAKDGVTLSGYRKALVDLKPLNGTLPKIGDSIVDDDDIKYKIEDVEIYKIAGIKIVAELKVVM